MSDNAQTLIKSALRAIGAIASGEEPTATELADGLESLRFMLRHWSDIDLRIYYTTQDSLTMTGATYYTIGSGGDLDVDRPESIRGAYVDNDTPLDLISESRYRDLRISTSSGTAAYLWYSPEYPLGKLYPWPTGGTTLYIDSLKPLQDLDSLTTLVSLPPGYYDAIKWNLAIRLAPEYNVLPSPIVIGLAKSGLDGIEKRNFISKINTISPEVTNVVKHYESYDIDNG